MPAVATSMWAWSLKFCSLSNLLKLLFEVVEHTLRCTCTKNIKCLELRQKLEGDVESFLISKVIYRLTLIFTPGFLQQ